MLPSSLPRSLPTSESFQSQSGPRAELERLDVGVKVWGFRDLSCTSVRTREEGGWVGTLLRTKIEYATRPSHAAAFLPVDN